MENFTTSDQLQTAAKLYWPALLAALSIVYLSVRSSVWFEKKWFPVVLQILALTLVGTGVTALMVADSMQNIPYRDIASVMVVACVVPVQAYLVCQWLVDRKVWLRMMAAFGAALAVVFASPAVSMLVHCSSGRCI